MIEKFKSLTFVYRTLQMLMELTRLSKLQKILKRFLYLNHCDNF